MASNESRSGSVRLVQFTDTHLLDDPDGILRGARTLPRLQACIAHAQRHFFPADVVAVTGDIVHDDPRAYGIVDLLFGTLGIPVLLIPGNHDLPDEMHRRFAHAPFQVGGEYRTTNGWQVLLLESWFAESEDGEGRLGDEQVRQVRQSLAQGTDPHAFVFLHHPPIPMESPALDKLGLLDADALLAAIAGNPRVARGVLGPRAPGPRHLREGGRAVHVHARDRDAVPSAPADVPGRRSAARLSRDRPGRGRFDRVRGRVARGLPRRMRRSRRSGFGTRSENRPRHGRRGRSLHGRVYGVFRNASRNPERRERLFYRRNDVNSV